MLNIITITKDDYYGLKKTVESTKCLREFYQVQQIVVDSSKGDVKQKVNTLVGKLENAYYVEQGPLGIASAFNFGLQAASEKWVWFLNGGDEVHPNIDLELFTKILKYSHADALVFDLEYSNGLTSKRPAMPFLWPPVFNWVPHPATVLQRDILLEARGFREDYKIAMDGELWIRLFSKPIIVDLISIPLAKFQPGGISSNESKTAVEAKRIIEQHKFLLLKLWLRNGLRTLKAWYKFGVLEQKER